MKKTRTKPKKTWSKIVIHVRYCEVLWELDRDLPSSVVNIDPIEDCLSTNFDSKVSLSILYATGWLNLLFPCPPKLQFTQL